MLLNLSQFFLPFIPLCPIQHHPPALLPPTLSSCPCVVHIISWASPFLTLFLTSPCLFCAYELCFLFSVPFPSILPLPFPNDNPPCDLHVCDSVPVLVVCFCFLGSAVESYEFVAISLLMVFDLLLFLR